MAITLLEMLLQAKMLTPQQIDDALQNRVFYGGKIGTNLVELGFLREEDLALFLSRKLSVPYIEPQRLFAIPPEVIALLPRDLALKYRAIPLGLEKKRLSLVMADPSDLAAIDNIAFITGYVIKPLITPEFRLLQALAQYYGMEIDERYQRIIARLDAERAKEPPAPPPPPTVAAAAPAGTPPPAPAPPATPPAALSGTIEESALDDELTALLDAEVVEDESWSRKIAHYSITEVSRRLAYVEDREEIAAILLDTLGREFACVALFAIRGDVASGWRALRNRQEIADFPLLHIPFARPSALRLVAEGQSYYLGPLADTPLNTRIDQTLRGKPGGSVLIMPLVILGRVINILYIEAPDDDLAERVDEVRKLLGKAALAFEILICRDKILIG